MEKSCGESARNESEKKWQCMLIFGYDYIALA